MNRCISNVHDVCMLCMHYRLFTDDFVFAVSREEQARLDVRLSLINLTIV